jgi:phage gpG-like protein
MVGSMATILGDIVRHKTVFDLDQNSLGEDLLEIAVEEIERNLYNEVDIEGVPFAPLTAPYATWKERYYPGRPIAELTGAMKEEVQIVGERKITAKNAEMVYGVDQENKQVATFFQEPYQAKPARRFYGLTQDAKRRSTDHLRHHFQTNI